MTVSYQYEVASSTSGGFTRLLFMWKGSLYKLIYRELLLFIGAFGLLSALYRHAFNQDQRRIFEKMVVYCDTFINLIPLSFVLGFYVAYVAGRWWQQYTAIPWPDKIMHSIALYVSGNDEHGRMIRRTLMRYLNLTLILVLRSISSAVKRRFPTLDHVVDSGFMTVIEREMYQSVPSVEFNTYWIPCTWFISLLKETRTSSRLTDSQGLKIIMEEFNEFRSKCGLLWSYDWVSIPLVYTQVVTIATYSFFLAALVGRQYVDVSKKPLQMEIDIYIPVFTILQFFFFMGLLKVAEQLINPFGDDDEDFELNWLIDRHTKVSYLGVDTLMRTAPPLVKDMYFDKIDLTLPYTEASVIYKKKTYRGSVHNMQVPEEKHGMYLPEIAEEDEDRMATPKASYTNLYNVTNTGSTVPAAAAGTWRSHPSAQSLYKGSEMDLELETDFSSYQHLEMCIDGHKPYCDEQTRKEEETVSMTNSMESSTLIKPTRSLSRSESAPVKKSVFSISKHAAVWPSSSTLGFMHPSEYSTEPHSYNHSSTMLSATDNVSLADKYQKSSLSTMPKQSTNSQTSELAINVQTVTGYCPPSPRYSSKEILFHNRSKIKSCPKLVPIRVSSSGNRKKGVRWKPMPDETGGVSKLEKERRRTVDVVPVTCTSNSSLIGTGFEYQLIKEGDGVYTSNSCPQSCCKCCNKKPKFILGNSQEFQEGARGSSDHQLSVSGSILNTSILQDQYCHQQNVPQLLTSKNTSDHRSNLPPKCGSKEERRATISVVNISGSEFDSKRWQGKPLWYHKFSAGFLRKLRGLEKQGAQSSEFTKVSNKNLNFRKTNYSLPNIRLAAFQETQDPVNHNPHTESTTFDRLPINIVVKENPTNNFSGSDDSSLFSSLSEFPIQEIVPNESQRLSTVAEGIESSEELPYSLTTRNSSFPHTNQLNTNDNSEIMSASLHESSWQSADWTTLLHDESNHGDQINTKDISNNQPSEPPEEQMANTRNEILQEVIVNEDTRPCDRWRNQSGS